MLAIRYQLVDDAINKIYKNIYNDFHERFEIGKQTILADESLTKNEKLEVIRRLNEDYDYDKILYNEGTNIITQLHSENNPPFN